MFLVQVVFGKVPGLLLIGSKLILYLIIRRLNLDVVNQSSPVPLVLLGYRRKWGVASLRVYLSRFQFST